MTTNHATQTRATIPSPLPHHRGVLSLPESLKTSITSALFASNDAIPNIQSAMRDSLTRPTPSAKITSVAMKQDPKQTEATPGEHGYMGALGTWLATEFSNLGADVVGDEEMLRRLMDAVRVGIAGGEERAGGEEKGEGSQVPGLKVPEQAVSEIVGAVRRELERCCVVVDGDEWVG